MHKEAWKLNKCTVSNEESGICLGTNCSVFNIFLKILSFSPRLSIFKKCRCCLSTPQSQETFSFPSYSISHNCPKQIWLYNVRSSLCLAIHLTFWIISLFPLLLSSCFQHTDSKWQYLGLHIHWKWKTVQALLFLFFKCVRKCTIIKFFKNYWK